MSPRNLSDASLESQGGGYEQPLQEPRSQGCSYEAVLTIEEVHTQMNSCFTCGVNWAQQHVSLDCDECGGYALVRPCPLCEASACGETWKRDLTMVCFQSFHGNNALISKNFHLFVLITVAC